MPPTHTNATNDPYPISALEAKRAAVRVSGSCTLTTASPVPGSTPTSVATSCWPPMTTEMSSVSVTSEAGTSTKPFGLTITPTPLASPSRTTGMAAATRDASL